MSGMGKFLAQMDGKIFGRLRASGHDPARIGIFLILRLDRRETESEIAVNRGMFARNCPLFLGFLDLLDQKSLYGVRPCPAPAGERTENSGKYAATAATRQGGTTVAIFQRRDQHIAQFPRLAPIPLRPEKRHIH